MKTIKLFIPIIILCLACISQAQTYQYPSQERIEELLNSIENCKSTMTETEELIEAMEKSPDNYTLAQYKECKDFIERIKICLRANRNELANIKKEYPGWFNSPSSVMPLGRGKEITAHSLEEGLIEIGKKIEQVLKAHNSLKEPKK